MVCGSPVLLLVLVAGLSSVSHCRPDLRLPGTSDLQKGIYYEAYPLREFEESASSSSSGGPSEAVDFEERIQFQRNCTAPTIQDFPPDMFTQEGRQQGMHS